MKIVKYLVPVFMAAFLSAPVSLKAQSPLSIDLRPDRENAVAPSMGDHLRFWSTIRNDGAVPIQGVVAWISLIEMDAGHEQPVDLEDWSAHKAITGTALGPGGSLRTDWPMRLIKGGDYRVVVSVTERGTRQVFTSPTIEFQVRPKKVLETKRVLAVAAGVPLLITGLIIFNRCRNGRTPVS